MTTSTQLWAPSANRRERATMLRFMQAMATRTQQSFPDYASLYEWSVRETGMFWREAADFLGLRWQTPPQQAWVPPPAGKMRGSQWFVGARLNYAENMLPAPSSRVIITAYREGEAPERLQADELCRQVAAAQAALQAAGVGMGDRVAGFVCNSVEAIVAMLATASLGAVWTSCSPDFGEQAVVDRFSQVAPKVFFYSDAYRYNGKLFDVRATAAAVLQRLPSVDLAVRIHHGGEEAVAGNWQAFLRAGGHELAGTASMPVFTPVPFDHPLYIMYSSGTTGVPKCIVHGVGGTLLQHKKELMLHTDLGPGKSLLYYTTCGWMMWNWMVSALATGASLVLYEGSPAYPQPDQLWRVVAEEGVHVFGTSPKYIASCMNAAAEPGKTGHGFPALESILSTGSPLLPEHFQWVYSHVKADVLLASISGGTDIISCFMLGNPLLPVYAGEIQCRGLGMAVEAWDDEGQVVHGGKGELVCTVPFPSMPLGFWHDENGERYRQAYFAYYPQREVWRHGDFIEVTPRGGVVVFGRSDATLNPGGVRIGTAELYRVVESLPEVADSLAVSYEEAGDAHIVLCVKLKDNVSWSEAVVQGIKKTIRSRLSPRHVPSYLFPVADIPYTRSGKKVEMAVMEALQGRPIKNLSALVNAAVMDEYVSLGQSLRQELTSRR